MGINQVKTVDDFIAHWKARDASAAVLAPIEKASINAAKEIERLRAAIVAHMVANGAKHTSTSLGTPADRKLWSTLDTY
jgi:hypothetical protein